MFRSLPVYRSVVVEDVAGSHKLVRDLALERNVRKRAGGRLRICISIARRIHSGGQPINRKRSVKCRAGGATVHSE